MKSKSLDISITYRSVENGNLNQVQGPNVKMALRSNFIIVPVKVKIILDQN